MDIPGWRIGLDGSVAEIGSRGGIVLSWTVPGADGRAVEVVAGYRDSAERRRGEGARQGLLVPWSNRIKDARYTWEGREHDFGPAADGSREARHGLGLETGFELVEQTDACLVLRTTLTDPAYPVPVAVRVTYSLGHDLAVARPEEWSLSMTLEARNLGEVDAPIGLGWHPYIRWSAGSEGAHVSVPARLHVDTDAALIPLSGARAFSPVTSGKPAGTEPLLLISPEGLDDAWTGLETHDGIVTVEVDHPDGAATRLEADTRLDGMVGTPDTDLPGIGIIQLFTGESLAHRGSEAIAVEYCQFMTDAFNRPQLVDALRVGPGQTRSMHARLVHTL